MNSKSRKFYIRPCVVCGYKYSDRHHIYPKTGLMGTWKNKAVIYLCPNHHRYANMLQVMLKSHQPISFIETFAAENFDADFNTKVLHSLIDQYRATAEHLGGIAAWAFEQFFGGTDDRTD